MRLGWLWRVLDRRSWEVCGSAFSSCVLHLPQTADHGSEAWLKDGPALAGHGAEAARDAIARTTTTLLVRPPAVATWDPGAEMSQHARNPWLEDTGRNI